MQLVLHAAHAGEGQFPTFACGESVIDLQPCPDYHHWYSGKVQGVATYFPHTYLDWQSDTIAVLKEDYNPTELDLAAGAIVTLQRIVFAWAQVQDKHDRIGWMPCNKLISKKE